MARLSDPSRCPRCRERVTPFAAGCAICGTDLDLRRFDRGPTVMQRVESQFAALRMGPRPAYRGVTVILVVVLAYAILSRLPA
jgi:hypothetical protein